MKLPNGWAHFKSPCFNPQEKFGDCPDTLEALFATKEITSDYKVWAWLRCNLVPLRLKMDFVNQLSKRVSAYTIGDFKQFNAEVDSLNKIALSSPDFSQDEKAVSAWTLIAFDLFCAYIPLCKNNTTSYPKSANEVITTLCVMPKLMDKHIFVQLLDALQAQSALSSKRSSLFGDIFESADSSCFLHESNPLEDAVLEVLEDGVFDTNQWIRWFVYENNFGRGTLEASNNGKPIDTSSASALYDNIFA